MPNKNYRAGYIFELKVKKAFERLGCFVIRQGKSAFPDLVICPPVDYTPEFWKLYLEHLPVSPIFIECKKAKYLNKEEKEKLAGIEEFGVAFVAYPEKNPDDRRKIDIVIARYEDYETEFRI